MNITAIIIGLISLIIGLLNVSYINRNFDRVLPATFVHLLIVYHLISILLDGYLSSTIGTPILITGVALFFTLGLTLTSIYAKLNY